MPQGAAPRRAGAGRGSWGGIGVQTSRRQRGEEGGTGAPWVNKGCGTVAKGGEGAVGAAAMGRTRRVAGEGLVVGIKNNDNNNNGKGYVAERGAPGGGTSPDSGDRGAHALSSWRRRAAWCRQRGPGRVVGLRAGGREGCPERRGGRARVHPPTHTH